MQTSNRFSPLMDKKIKSRKSKKVKKESRVFTPEANELIGTKEFELIIKHFTEEGDFQQAIMNAFFMCQQDQQCGKCTKNHSQIASFSCSEDESIHPGTYSYYGHTIKISRRELDIDGSIGISNIVVEIPKVGVTCKYY